MHQDNQHDQHFTTISQIIRSEDPYNMRHLEIPLQASKPGMWVLSFSGMVEKNTSIRSEVEIELTHPGGIFMYRIQLNSFTQTSPITNCFMWNAESNGKNSLHLIIRPVLGQALVRDIQIREVYADSQRQSPIKTLSNSCICDMSVLMMKGCQCGGK